MPTPPNFTNGPTATVSYDGAAITPSDTVDLPAPARAIFVGGAGNIVLVTLGGTTLTFQGLLAGQILPVAASRVRATSTTATNLIALF
jgi:hypothetical protein